LRIYLHPLPVPNISTPLTLPLFLFQTLQQPSPTLRMIIGNLMTYGLRLKFNRSVMQAMLPTLMSRDDVITLLAIPLTCLLFALGALCIERLGLWTLLAQEKVREEGDDDGVCLK